MPMLLQPADRAVPQAVDRAAVVGCGGVLGVAWAIGLVAGLEHAGLNVRDADLLVGASAGAVAAAQLASSVPLQALLAEQFDAQAGQAEQFRPYSQAAVDAANQQLVDRVRGNLQQARQRIGAYALRSATVSADERRQIVRQRLALQDWPRQALKIVVVNVHSGEARVLDRDCGVDFVDAITASCAVPGVWPVVAIDDGHYMDGGIRSMTNADLAAGARSVLVIAPLGYSRANPVSGHLDAEIALLQSQGAQIHVIEPDAASLQAMGPNILDPSRRAEAAQAGWVQGLVAAGPASRIWNPHPAH